MRKYIVYIALLLNVFLWAVAYAQIGDDNRLYMLGTNVRYLTNEDTALTNVQIVITNQSDLKLVFFLRPNVGKWKEFYLLPKQHKKYNYANHILINTYDNNGLIQAVQYHLNQQCRYKIEWNTRGYYWDLIGDFCIMRYRLEL